MCRPPIDYERAFAEAVEQMRRRETGDDVWSAPAIYWAAVTLWSELQSHPYASIKGRWHAALDEAVEGVRSGRLPSDIPRRVDALPAPGRCSVPPEVARGRIAEIMKKLKGVVVV
jgi:hypothetical protein